MAKINKKAIKSLVEECVDEMMNVGKPTPKKGGDGIEKTIKTTNQVIDALANGRIDAPTAKKLIAKIARADIERATLVASVAGVGGGGCQY